MTDTTGAMHIIATQPLSATVMNVVVGLGMAYLALDKAVFHVNKIRHNTDGNYSASQPINGKACSLHPQLEAGVAKVTLDVSEIKIAATKTQGTVEGLAKDIRDSVESNAQQHRDFYDCMHKNTTDIEVLKATTTKATKQDT